MKAAGRTIFAAVLLSLAVPAAPQASPAVTVAMKAGIVGERYDGFMGFAATPTDALRRQVGAINIKRRSLYTSLAARRTVSVQAVGIATGCELLGKVEVGQSYMLQDGVWRRRMPEEAPPVPGYCGN